MASPVLTRVRLAEALRLDRSRIQVVLGVAGAAAVVAGVALRFWSPSQLWLDEAQSVNIARLPLSRLPAALSHDGSPPLYYLLLHFWMRMFGAGNAAVRSLSGLTSVAALPFFWAAGRRVGGSKLGWVTLFLALGSPFAISYATSARMYSLMILLSLLGYLALGRLLERPSRSRQVALGAVTAALLYTHYWGLYLVLVVAAWLAWRALRRGDAGAGKALWALAGGVVAWLPWSPVFAFQLLHTGTPWTSPASPGDLIGVFGDYSGVGSWGELVMFALFALVLLGVFGRPSGPLGDRAPAVTIAFRPRRDTSSLAAVTAATLVLAVALGALAGAAFVARYTAVVLPLFLLVAAAGVGVLPGRRFVAGCTAVVCLAGLLSGLDSNRQQRTQAVRVAAVLDTQAQPGDLVVYCPDQLGPAASRLVTAPGVGQITFPRATGPDRVDWVDYKKVIAATNVEAFAKTVLERLGNGHTLWLVWRDGYPGFGGDCGYLRRWFDLLLAPGSTIVRAEPSGYYESENLTRY